MIQAEQYTWNPKRAFGVPQGRGLIGGFIWFTVVVCVGMIWLVLWIYLQLGKLTWKGLKWLLPRVRPALKGMRKRLRAEHVNMTGPRS